MSSAKGIKHPIEGARFGIWHSLWPFKYYLLPNDALRIILVKRTCLRSEVTALKIRVIGRTVLCNSFLRCLFTFISPLHVSALAGHLQAEYTIIFGMLPHYSGSVILCYRSYFVYGLANTAVVYLICENVKDIKRYINT
jgi:hypothetical protein